MYKKTLQAALGLSIALLGTAAYAETLTGTYVNYTFDESALGMFGTAALSASGDGLVFSPVDFMATTSGTVFAQDTIYVTVTANPGYQLTAFGLSETGRYSRSGDGPLGVTGQFGLTDVEGTTVNHILATIEASPGSFTEESGSWAAQAAITLPATGWGGADGSVGSVSLEISNLLDTSGFSGSASIYKDFIGLSAFTTTVSPVPEANTYAMMLAGLGLVGFMARRRINASA
ncbi:MAG: PEP-CTERM sorting domain-containing protein [Sulfuriferula multivorans]|uniref:PEP-CTERM sorting domain-containing protein n=1 Tax=Sulfuriferula multivorans TaxID=1559896 RepID=A0A7C9P8J1_9PROT|nr:PEP-CTERM sorting domain-containing protein [Sulfuriferula multivorans]